MEHLTGVGGHFLRVIKSAGAGHARGVSGIVEVIVSGRRTVRSHGGVLRLSFGAVNVSAPAGAIRRGQTLTLSVGDHGGVGVMPGSSVSGGPYRLSTSQGEPSKLVTVTLPYNTGLLGAGDHPLILHDSTVAHGWVPVATTINASAHTVRATLGSFSLLGVVDDGTYYAGLLTGNRSDLPDCKGGATPSWVDSVTLPDSNQDPLPMCFASPAQTTEAKLSMVNNRGFAQVITVSGAPVDGKTSSFSDSADGEAATVFAKLHPANGPATFVLGPGQSATLFIEEPAPSLAAVDVHIDPATHTGSAIGEMAWAFLTTAIDKIGAPVDLANCVWGYVYNQLNAPGPGAIINETHSCTSATIAKLGSKAARDALTNLAYGLLVDDFFYKVIDAEGDALYPPMIGFTIPGSNPTSTNPSIHLGPAGFGTLPDGQTTIEHLAATGGTPPYRYYIWNDSTNMAGVPSWVNLASDGTLTIEPPVGAVGEVSFYVYVFDSKGEHSPFARDKVTFQTFSASEKEGGGGLTGQTLAASIGYTCAIVTSGTVDCWGANGFGQLGDGTDTGQETCRTGYQCDLTPVQVSGITNATQVAAGGIDSCAVLASGQVDCWGANYFGQLGDGTDTGPETCTSGGGAPACSTTPVQVNGITNATQVAVGYPDSCAVLASGQVDCWGSNEQGALGLGSSTGPEVCASSTPCSTTPVQVSGITDATQVVVAEGHACALLASRQIDCWGSNYFGQLGDGKTCPSGYPCLSAPVQVNGITNATQVAVGYLGGCALLASGQVNCWGSNYYGQLGDGTTTGPETCPVTAACSRTPVSVSGITNATQVAAGYHGACAMLTTGQVDCWGSNEFGELGSGTNMPETCGFAPCSATPVSVSEITTAIQLAAGYLYACATLATGQVDCWGNNEDGELGDGTTENRDTPVAVTGLP